MVITHRDNQSIQCEFQSSGLILRRCTLDAVGLAYWESPTHIKCISENYKTIQTMVSLRLARSSRPQALPVLIQA